MLRRITLRSCGRISEEKVTWWDLRKQPTFRDTTIGLTTEWRLRTECRNPYWWRAITQFWLVLLIGWKFASFNQEHYPDLGSDTSSVWNVCDRSSDGLESRIHDHAKNRHCLCIANRSFSLSTLKLFMHNKKLQKTFNKVLNLIFFNGYTFTENISGMKCRDFKLLYLMLLFTFI